MAIRRRAAGFTLVEILIVVVIIGSLATLVVLNLGGDRGRAQQDESRRLHAMLRMAADLAILESREIGLQLNPDSYRFLQLDPDSQLWVEIEEEGYGSHPLPADIELELELEGALPSRLKKKDRSSQPAVILYSSGEITPFTISVGGADRARPPWLISSDGFSAIELLPQDSGL